MQSLRKLIGQRPLFKSSSIKWSSLGLLPCKNKYEKSSWWVDYMVPWLPELPVLSPFMDFQQLTSAWLSPIILPGDDVSSLSHEHILILSQYPSATMIPQNIQTWHSSWPGNHFWAPDDVLVPKLLQSRARTSINARRSMAPGNAEVIPIHQAPLVKLCQI